MAIREWLEGIGLGEFADTFEREQVGLDDVEELIESDLKDLGLPLGPRKRFLKAASALRRGAHQQVHSHDEASPAASPEAPVSEADRRPVTVLFADVSGFTAFGERLDAEDLRALQSDLHRETSSVMADFGGFLEKFVGDAALAVFGAPVAHEDDPARALRAALALRERIAALNEHWEKGLGRPLALHMGVNTGPVVAGTLGAAGVGAYAVTGDVVNTAARLQAAARQQEILVGPSTHQLTQHLFMFELAGPLEMKNKRHPVQAYRLLGIQRGAGSGRGLASLGLSAPMVGRNRELSQMQSALNHALRGHAQVVRVFGEAGCGKTRLVEEFLSRLDYKVVLRRAVCSPLGEQTLGALASLVRDDFAIGHDDPVDTVREKLVDGLIAIGVNEAERDHLTACFAFVLGIGTGDATLAQLEPEQLKRQIFVAARSLAEQRLLEGPLLLVIEDLHWADAASVEHLRYLVDRLDDRPLMLVVTHRPDFQADRLASSRASQTALRLADLSAIDSEALVSGLFGGDGDPLSHELRQFVVDRSGGNPLYLAEIIRSLVESGVLTHSTDGWTCTDTPTSCDVPLTISGLLLSRIDRLAPGVRRLAQEASVLGVTFNRAVLTRITAALASELDAALEALCDAELIREVRAGQSSAPQSETHDRLYRFSHAIVQEVVYQNLLLKQREVLHGRVGDVLQAASSDSLNRLEDIELLAHHFSLSDDKARAIRYLVDAGDWARQLYANDDALRHYRRAFDLVDTCDTSVVDRLRVLERLADLLGIVGQRDEALRHYQALVDLAGSNEAVGKARLHRKIATLHWEAGARDRANAELQSALALLQPEDHSIERALLCHEFGRLAFRSGDYHRAMDWAERAITAALPFLEDGAQSSDAVRGTGFSASAAAVVAEANNTLGVTHARLGEIDDAIRHVERSLKVAVAHSFDQATCRACANLGILYGNRDPARAIQLSQQGLDIAKKMGHLAFQSTLYTNLGMALCTFHVRCDREGVDAVKKSVELDRRLNLLDHLPMPLIALGQLYQCHGQPRQALDYYREALRLAEALDEPQVLFHCYDGLAAALLDVDDLAGARDYLCKAQALCERTGIDRNLLLVMPFLY